MSIIKKAIKWFFYLLSATVFIGGIVILILDIDPAFAKSMIWTQDALAVYRADPDAYELYDMKVSPNYTTDGNFFCSNARYSPTSSQVILTVRFNKSTLSHCMEDYHLSEVPEWNTFRYVLRDGNRTYYTNTSYLHLEKGRHHYIRLVFSDITPQAMEKLTLCAYYENADDLPYGEIRLTDGVMPEKLHSLKKKDIPAADLAQTPDLIVQNWLPKEKI